MDDKYAKLYPPQPTPADDLCACPDAPPLKLMYALGYNPIHCLDCNLEVPSERLDLIDAQIDGITYWRNTYGAIYRLWLESGPYEAWALAELSNIASPVNVEGREVQRKLDGGRRCYYWYFQDQSDDDYTPISQCPSCGQLWRVYDGGIFRQLICDDCGIVTPGV